MAGLDRLILYTDSLARADVYTFKNAALTLKNGYAARYPKDKARVVFARSGKEIVNTINRITTAKLISLDVVSHGNQSGIHITRKLPKPEKAGVIQRNAHVVIRRFSDRPQTDADAEYMEESMHGLYSDYMSKLAASYYFNQTYSKSADTAYLDEIRFDRFAPNAVVEFHGCRTAEIIPALNSWLKGNFAENFSEGLSERGIVIGHITNSAPDKNPNGNKNDYRYGKVRVYRNSRLIKDAIERASYRAPNSSTP